jgi:hypothetical protein
VSSPADARSPTPLGGESVATGVMLCASGTVAPERRSSAGER